MKLNIKATNTTLTDALKEYVENKLEGISQFIRPEDKIHIEIEVDKKRTGELPFRAEIMIRPRGSYAEARGVDVYAAFDLVLPKIKEQMSREKDRQVSLRRKKTRPDKSK